MKNLIIFVFTVLYPLSVVCQEWISYPLNDPYFYNVRSIVFDSSGNVYIGTMRGIMKFNQKEWVLIDSITTDKKHDIWYIWTQCVDKSNNLWASNGKGLFKYDGNEWYEYRTDNSGLANNKITGLSIDNNGDLWITSQSPYINRFNGKDFIKYDILELKLPFINTEREPFCICNNHFWYLAGKELVRFDGTNWTVFDSLNSPLQNNYPLFEIICTKDSSLLVGSEDCKLFKFKNNVWDVIDLEEKGVVAKSDSLAISCLREDYNGNIWINFGRRLSLSSTRSRFMKITKDYKATTIKVPSETGRDPDLSTNIYSFSIDKDNRIWLGLTTEGLKIYDPRYTSIEEDKVLELHSKLQSIIINKNYLNILTSQVVLEFLSAPFYSKKLSAFLYDYTGNLIQDLSSNIKYDNITGKGELEFNADYFNTGFYILTIKNRIDQTSAKILIYH